MFKIFDEEYTNRIRVAQIFIYGWVIANTLYMLPGHRSFWGDTDLIPIRDLSAYSWIERSMNLLFLPEWASWYPLFIALQLLGCAMVISRKLPTIGAILCWLMTVNLDNRIYVTMDGGNNLIALLLFYGIFYASYGTHPLLKGMAVSSYYVSRAQVCILYFMAGITKATGQYWVKGMGLYYALTVDEYSHPFLQELMLSSPWISVIGSYVTLLFQISFPFLIWVKQLRPWYFLLGTMIHLGISFGMGLMFFGFAMVVSYKLFYTEDRAEEVIAVLNRYATKVLMFFKGGSHEHVETADANLPA